MEMVQEVHCPFCGDIRIVNVDMTQLSDEEVLLLKDMQATEVVCEDCQTICL